MNLSLVLFDDFCTASACLFKFFIFPVEDVLLTTIHMKKKINIHNLGFGLDLPKMIQSYSVQAKSHSFSSGQALGPQV